MRKLSKDTPLSEITLRRYEKPGVEGRELVRKLCLSLGLLQPGDSRDVIVDVFAVIIKESRDKKCINTSDLTKKVIIYREENKLDNSGTAESNIARQIRRLKELLIVEKINGGYRLVEGYSLFEIFSEKISRLIINNISERISEYCQTIDISDKI